MDPFTLALATFGVQKLRGKSTKRSLRDALVIGGMGQLGGMAGVGGLSAFGQTGANTLAGSTLGAQFGNTATMTGIKSLFPQVAGSQATAPGFSGMTDPGTMQGLVGNEGGSNILSNLIPKTTAGKVALGSAILPLLGGMGGGEDMAKPPGLNQNYQKLMESGFAGGPTGFQTRAYNDDGTYSDNTLEDKNTYQSVEAILGEDQPAMKTGGIVSVAKFNTGGQALPSKFSHSENDANNYTRAYGFVKDAAGMCQDDLIEFFIGLRFADQAGEGGKACACRQHVKPFAADQRVVHQCAGGLLAHQNLIANFDVLQMAGQRAVRDLDRIELNLFIPGRAGDGVRAKQRFAVDHQADHHKFA